MPIKANLKIRLTPSQGFLKTVPVNWRFLIQRTFLTSLTIVFTGRINKSWNQKTFFAYIRKLFDIGEGNSNPFPKGNLPHYEVGHRRFHFTHSTPREAHSNLAEGFLRAMVIILSQSRLGSKAENLPRSKNNMFIV